MKKPSTSRKNLELNSQTLRHLTEQDLDKVGGGDVFTEDPWMCSPSEEEDGGD